MKTRLFARLHLAAAFLFTIPSIGAAQDAYPSRAVTFVATAPAGGGIDFLARLISEPLSRSLGQSVVVDNKPGASGGIGSQYVARAKADGYTLLVTYSGFHVGTPNLFKNQQWDPLKDFAAVSMIATSPQVIVVRPTLPVHSLQELIDYARKNPGKLNYASSGNGSVGHVAAELFKQVTATNMVHVPYKGASTVIPGLMAGQVDLYIETPGGLMQQIKSGALRAVAVTGKNRLASLPDVPTVEEAGLSNYNLDSWFAVYAPIGTPVAVITKLNAELNKVLSDAGVKQRLTDVGLQIELMTPPQLAQYTRIDLQNWRNIVTGAKISLD